MAGKPPLSPSAIATFERCPLWFRFQYIERRRGEDKPTVPRGLGNLSHAVLRWAFGQPAERRTPVLLAATVGFLWQRYCPHTLFDGHRHEAACSELCLGRLTRYIETTDHSAETIERERGLRAVLPHGAHIGGRLDRIDRLRDGRLRVIDYKTGRHRLMEDELRTEPAAQIYLLLASQAGEVESVRFVYLDSGEEPVFAPELEDLPFIADAVEARIDGIWATREHEARPGQHCAWCPFLQACAAGGGAGVAGGAGPCSPFQRPGGGACTEFQGGESALYPSAVTADHRTARS